MRFLFQNNNLMTTAPIYLIFVRFGPLEEGAFDVGLGPQKACILG